MSTLLRKSIMQLYLKIAAGKNITKTDFAILHNFENGNVLHNCRQHEHFSMCKNCRREKYYRGSQERNTTALNDNAFAEIRRGKIYTTLKKCVGQKLCGNCRPPQKIKNLIWQFYTTFKRAILEEKYSTVSYGKKPYPDRALLYPVPIRADHVGALSGPLSGALSGGYKTFVGRFRATRFYLHNDIW